MAKLGILFSLALAGALAFAAVTVVPRGYEAGQWLHASGDPVRLSDFSLDHVFTAEVAQREIETALAAQDYELAQSFIALAQERGVDIDQALITKVEVRESVVSPTGHNLGQFARGFITGEPDDLASLAGTATGDLFVFGDIRDAVREGVRLARGEEADQLVLGLACVGLVITAGTYASFGAGAPARVGMTVIKAASKTGRMGAKFTGSVVRSLGQVVDQAALRQAFTRAAFVRPVIAIRAAREAVKVEKAGGLVTLMKDVGRVQAKAGTRAALDGLRIAEEPKEVARLARLAEAKGLKTRAVVKVLGRGAIVLASGAFNLAMWIFWAIVNVVVLFAAIKRTAERMTLAWLRRSKARKLARRERAVALREQALAPAAAAG